MARVTVEDCVDKIKNRFELVVLATQRAKAITAGARITVDRDNDKNAVVALREIACQNVKPEALRDLALKSLNKDYSVDEEDVIDENSNLQEESLAQEQMSDLQLDEDLDEEDDDSFAENDDFIAEDFIGEEIFFEDEDEDETKEN